MIQQFVSLGTYFMSRDEVVERGADFEQYAQDPAQKFRSKTVYLLLLKAGSLVRVQVEEYSAENRAWYLYRAGPPNGADATPTTGLQSTKDDREFEQALTKRVKRLAQAVRSALELRIPDEDPQDIEALEVTPSGLESETTRILAELKSLHPNPKEPAILSVGWLSKDDSLRRVGDFAIFKRAVVHSAKSGFAGKKTQGASTGHGQCSICGAIDVDVSGGLQVPNFKFYTLDKQGSVAGGFDRAKAWINFPACSACCEAADYAGERVKSELAFTFYGFKYLVLPLPILPKESPEAFATLTRLSAARMNRTAIRRLTDAEDEILYAVAEEQNLLQVDLLFYQPDPNYFRPVLYIPGLLPTHFQQLFVAKQAVDGHPWFEAQGQDKFASGEFTFKSLRDVFPAAHGGSTFDDDFLEAVRCALDLRPYPRARLVSMGMRWIRERFAERGGVDETTLGQLTRTLMFFDALRSSSPSPDADGDTNMNRDIYGTSPQADRVRAFFEHAEGRLRSEPAAQSAFLMGACCKRIMDIQDRIRGARPFLGKLKGLRLNEVDLRRLLPEIIDKAEAYGDENRRIVAPLTECTGAAMASAGDVWQLTADEVSYYFALGLVLARRLAAEGNDGKNGST